MNSILDVTAMADIRRRMLPDVIRRVNENLRREGFGAMTADEAKVFAAGFCEGWECYLHALRAAREMVRESLPPAESN